MTGSGANDGSPRRILAIDGGGVRCAIAVEVLACLENRLAATLGQSRGCLADHFDLVAGTSGGAIIASAIALGIQMREVRDFIRANRKIMFRSAGWWNRYRYWYDKQALEKYLKDWFGADTKLGSDKLRTLVLLVMRNVSTDSAWIVSNSPSAPFNHRERDDSNLDVNLWQLARASAAAPTYFAPEIVTLGRARPYRFVFIDGGLTGLNNPAFKAFLFATTEPYGLRWATGEEKLVVLSLGSGTGRHLKPHLPAWRMHLLHTAREAPRALIYAADVEQDVLCRTFGRCLMGDTLNLEIGDLRTCRTAVEPKLFSYFRINATLTREGLDGLGCSHLDPTPLLPMDAVDHVDGLQEVGRALAEKTVTDELIERITASGTLPTSSRGLDR
jgi:hypothetical protein